MNARILLVDDNVFDRELVAWALRRLPSPPGPVELRCAGGWEEARALLAAGDVDVLLLDHDLPGRTGLEILRTEPMPGRPHVIMITGREDLAVAAGTLEEGAYGYVLKDMDWVQAVQQAVTRALEVRAS